MAKSRLQEYYRRQKEERLKEEQEAMNRVFQATIKTKFKGHRNARTMVRHYDTSLLIYNLTLLFSIFFKI